MIEDADSYTKENDEDMMPVSRHDIIAELQMLGVKTEALDKATRRLVEGLIAPLLPASEYPQHAVWRPTKPLQPGQPMQDRVRHMIELGRAAAVRYSPQEVGETIDFLEWLLQYNFSVAVWVGFIALFGAAVQTGIVMVVYLDEAVKRKKAALGRLDRESLKDAVMEGALLRLRPKVMTVTTIVAGLLPIMLSTGAGSEVMKPLATPLFGGMMSSLLHVLIVTPVIFYWLRLRELSRAERGII